LTRDVEAVIQEIIAARVNHAKTTPEEIIAWRDEGRRF